MLLGEFAGIKIEEYASLQEKSNYKPNTMKTKAEEYFDNTGIPCDSYLTREIVINMLAGFATQQVNLLSKPAVSGSFCNCESLEKELHYGYGLPVCFKCNKAVKLQNDH